MTNVFTAKFVKIIKTWQPEELKAFESWLRSPWCNSNKNLVRLFECLRKYYPEFDDKRLTKEKLFHKILPDGKFSDRRINNLFSEGFLAAQRFLIFQNLLNNQNLQDHLLTRELQNRYLEDWFFKATQKTIDRLEAKAPKDWEDHLELYQMHHQVYHHPNQNLRLQPGSSTIVNMGEQIDLVYLLGKASIINEKVFRSRILKDERHDIEAELKKWYAVSDGVQHPAIDLYRLRFAYTDEKRLEQYQVLRAAFKDRFIHLNPKEQKVHLLSLINDTMLLVKQGQLDVVDCLDLYQMGLENGMLMNKGKLSRNTYTLIVSASNTKASFEFTHRFIEQYTQHLDESIQTDCAQWAWAHTSYWQKDLDTSLGILQGYHFKTPYLQLIGRVLHTQIYFDLFLKDPSYQFYLFNYLDTFEKRLNRDKLWSKMNKVSFLRFVQKCRTLAKFYLDIGSDTTRGSKLLDLNENVQASNWLQQKKETVLQLKAKRSSKF
ncbi:MAG: hypothetical protein AAGG75_02855 [Bacteroidota bacterium]